MTNPYQGSLDSDPLSGTLESLQEAEASGVLRVVKDGCENAIVFRRGRIVSVSSDADVEENELARALVERGSIGPTELEEARKVGNASGMPLPRVLAELDILQSAEIESARAELERSRLYDVLAWQEGEYRFEESDPLSSPVADPSRLDLAPSDVLEQTRRGDPSRDEPASTRVIRWAATATPMPEVTLSTKESTLLDFLRAPANQNLTAAEIVARSPLSDAETIQILSKLLSAGVLEDREALRSPIDLSSTLAGAGAGAPGESGWSSSRPRPAPPRKLGRFVVEGTLGRGSMGAVLLAKDPAIDRTVAIKLIQTATHLSSSQTEKYRERFYREASAAGQLLHPHIATVFDVGHDDEGTPFIVMEYVKGRTLREALETEAFSVPETMRIARDVLEALGFAHAQGIVHRDVKPSNIMITPERRGKIMDFGIAHVVGSELTSAEDVLGSPYYMAPEQLSKGPIGPHTDLFSLAVVLYRMLTGVLPFTGESFAAIAHAILHENPAPPQLFSPQIPKGLSLIVLRCLSKAPEDRLQTAEEVLSALTDVAAGKEAPPLPPRSRRGLRSWNLPAGRRFHTLAALTLLGIVMLLTTRLALETTSFPPPPAPRPRLTTVPAPGAATPAPPTPQATISTQVEGNAAPSKPPTVGPSSTTPREPRPSIRAPQPTPPTPISAHRPTPPEPVEPASSAGETPPGDTSSTPSVADLFYQARLALERGELEEAKQRLDVLLQRDPVFAGGAELYTQVTDQIWERRLPIVITARHSHRLGSCEGELSLATIGVRYQSEDHDWAFARENIRVLEHPDDSTLVVETFEKDLLSLGKNKRYRFELEAPLSEEDWSRYVRLIK